MRLDIDEKAYRLYLKRLRDGRAAIKDLRRATSLTSAFQHWEERVERSLVELFGEDHPYHGDFAALSFSDGWPDEPEDWTSEDQEAFGLDLKAAERILDDAIEEAEHLAPVAVAASEIANAGPVDAAPVREREAVSPAVHVNVYNVLSQMTVASTAQIVASLHELNLSPSERAAAERLVEDFEGEAQGKQRWSKLGKTIDRLKQLGTSVYEKVAVPLLLEYLKRQLGIAGR